MNRRSFLHTTPAGLAISLLPLSVFATSRSVGPSEWVGDDHPMPLYVATHQKITLGWLRSVARGRGEHRWHVFYQHLEHGKQVGALPNFTPAHLYAWPEGPRYKGSVGVCEVFTFFNRSGT